MTHRTTIQSTIAIVASLVMVAILLAVAGILTVPVLYQVFVVFALPFIVYAGAMYWVVLGALCLSLLLSVWSTNGRRLTRSMIISGALIVLIIAVPFLANPAITFPDNDRRILRVTDSMAPTSNPAVRTFQAVANEIELPSCTYEPLGWSDDGTQLLFRGTRRLGSPCVSDVRTYDSDDQTRTSGNPSSIAVRTPVTLFAEDESLMAQLAGAHRVMEASGLTIVRALVTDDGSRAAVVVSRSGLSSPEELFIIDLPFE